MKKMMMLAAMVALVLAVAVPAVAQVSQGNANKDTSGNVTDTFSVQSTGNSSNQCVTPLQFGNTGSQQNAQGFLQYASTAGDITGTGPDGPPPGGFGFAPVLTAPCEQTVQQSSAASSGG